MYCYQLDSQTHTVNRLLEGSDQAGFRTADWQARADKLHWRKLTCGNECAASYTFRFSNEGVSANSEGPNGKTGPRPVKASFDR